jgi:SGNH domain (fused to AT3 domains)
MAVRPPGVTARAASLTAAAALVGVLLFAPRVPDAIALPRRSSPTPTTTAPVTLPPVPPPNPPSSILVVGDSVADSLGGALILQAASRGIALVSRVRPGCGLITGVPAYPTGSPIPWGPTCDNGTTQFLSDSMHLANPQVVLWLSTWETADRIVDGRFYPFGTPAADAVLLQKLDEARATLTSGGARLVMLTVAPHAVHSDTTSGDDSVDDAKYLHLDALFRLFAAQHPESVTVVDLAAIVCPTGPPCAEYVDGVRLRPHDGGHFAGDGPAWVAPRLLDAVMRELQPAPRAMFR